MPPCLGCPGPSPCSPPLCTPLVHGYVSLPNSYFNTTIVPICKNKNSNMSDTPNYRPVAVAKVLSSYLNTSYYLASLLSSVPQTINLVLRLDIIFLLKQTASYFVTRGSSVHAVFLDISKAFDRALHTKLFEKLIQRKVPTCFVRLLKHWHKEQMMQIKWDKHLSEPFPVSNGVRQGVY